MGDSITFLASIAPLQSAMTVSSDGGARVKLDKAMRLMAWRNQTLEITVRLCQQNRQDLTNGREDKDIVSTRAGRKSIWKAAEE